ncbi:MAG TPA: amidohydrolase, partial [Balneolaceae bacterium]|nr:amidohydrolase [Balneolaceae bacterium]
MKKLFLIFGLVLIFSFHLAAQQTVFTNVTVLPMDENRMLENQVVLVEGDRITAVASMGDFEIPDGATVINGTGKYLMPGLAEMHGHVPPTNPG